MFHENSVLDNGLSFHLSKSCSSINSIVTLFECLETIILTLGHMLTPALRDDIETDTGRLLACMAKGFIPQAASSLRIDTQKSRSSYCRAETCMC